MMEVTFFNSAWDQFAPFCVSSDNRVTSFRDLIHDQDEDEEEEEGQRWVFVGDTVHMNSVIIT